MTRHELREHGDRASVMLSAMKPTNADIAADFEEVADLLERRGGDVHRSRAYRAGARTLRALDRQVADIVAEGGRAALVELDAIGPRLAGVIEEYVATGRFALLDRMIGETQPEALFAAVPGIGEALAQRIHETLGVDTLEELELAAHDGRLDTVAGMGERRVRAVREALDAMLRRSTRRRARLIGRHGETTLRPSVGLLLAIDRDYRELARQDELPRIAPRRFNPEHEHWLPIWHTHRKGWDFDVMFSNTARAHALGRTNDWVVIYYGRDGDEGQCTVVTESRGPASGQRVVRGREHESAPVTARDGASRSA